MNSADRFITSEGRCIYSFQVQAFPSLVANIYLIDDGERLVLVDCGSGLDRSNEDLLDGIEAVQREYGLSAGLGDLDAILITHGHIDHFGGLPFLRRFSDAPIGVNQLDRRVLSNYEERVIVASRRLGIFLQHAGVSENARSDLMAMYLFAKGIYRSTAVQFALEEGRKTLEDIDVYHVPGHCPGQVCLRVDDILLTADHVLAKTSPHQAPESITNHTGLDHYLASLDKIAAVSGVRLALGGHEAPIADLPARAAEIQTLHQERLAKVLEICRQPRSTAEISRELFGQVSSYHVLLALEEAGAHVEYLYQRGELVAANLEEIESSLEPVIRYRRI